MNCFTDFHTEYPSFSIHYDNAHIIASFRKSEHSEFSPFFTCLKRWQQRYAIECIFRAFF